MLSRRNCNTCEWIVGNSKPRYDFIYQLDDYPKWYLNHYGDADSFIGRLAIQPSPDNCVDQFCDIVDSDALQQFGPACQAIQSAMFKIWNKIYPSDELQRIHITIFMESEFDEPDVIPEVRKFFHIHTHIIPRSIKTGRLIRRHLNRIQQYVPWDDYLVTSRMMCLEEYKSNLCDDNRVGAFMRTVATEIRMTKVVPNSILYTNLY